MSKYMNYLMISCAFKCCNMKKFLLGFNIFFICLVVSCNLLAKDKSKEKTSNVENKSDLNIASLIGSNKNKENTIKEGKNIQNNQTQVPDKIHQSSQDKKNDKSQDNQLKFTDKDLLQEPSNISEDLQYPTLKEPEILKPLQTSIPSLIIPAPISNPIVSISTMTEAQKLLNVPQRLSEQDSKLTKDSSSDSTQSYSIPNKQSQQSNPELKTSLSNQESFKGYKIKDTSYAKANDDMIYEVSLGIREGEEVVNNNSDYNFNNKWKLFLAKFNNGAVFVITDNYTWGASFRIGRSNHINDRPTGVSLELSGQDQISKFKNAMISASGEVFEAITYDDVENEISIRVNKNDNMDYVFLKFEVTNTAAENSSDSYEEEFDSFSTIKRFLSEKSFAVKKSDFNNLINIIE